MLFLEIHPATETVGAKPLMNGVLVTTLIAVTKHLTKAAQGRFTLTNCLGVESIMSQKAWLQNCRAAVALHTQEAETKDSALLVFSSFLLPRPQPLEWCHLQQAQPSYLS